MKKFLFALIGMLLFAGASRADNFYYALERNFTPLGNGGTYTSAMIEVAGYKTVNVNLLADKDSALNGLKISFYDRGDDGLPCSKLTYVANGAGWTYTSGISPESYAASVRGDCVQVTYTNSGTPQGSFYINIFATK